jgi:exopolysaccharide biosynthesis polyprenyl glycosylphosphotransferase
MMQTSVEVAPLPIGAAPSPASLAEVLGVRKPGSSSTRYARGAYLLRIQFAVDALALFGAVLFIHFTIGMRAQGSDFVRGDAVLALLAMPVWLLAGRARGLHHVPSRHANPDAAEELGTIVGVAALWSWGVGLVSPLAGVHTPTMTTLAGLWLATIVLVALARSAARSWSRRQAWYRQNAIIVGAPGDAARVLPKLLRHPEYGIDVVASVELPGLERDELPSPYPIVDDVPMIRGDVYVPELVEELGVDRVIFGPSFEQLPDFRTVLCELDQLGVHVDVVPSWNDVVGSRVTMHELEGMAIIGVPNTTLSRTALLCKRALDMTVAALGLLALAPVLAACAIAIKIDSPGPVFFRQRRVGRNGERFKVFKFRSMRAEAEAVKFDVAHLNVHGGGTAEGMFKIPDDPRVTRVGRWLRHHSLDELPQLINILTGNMSLVGPRPLIESEDVQIFGRHRRRSTLTPGLTGLWQVNGRSDIPFEGMIDLDYLYVTNWSLWGDIKLLLRTLSVITGGRGAY